MMKKFFILSMFVAGASVLSAFHQNDLPGKGGMAQVKTIIVDAGHGGEDNGAKGEYSYEKDVCLDIALKLGKRLEEGFPDIKILYTRTSDTYPSIRERADFANKNGGDLFISIHANAAPPIRHSTPAGYRKEVYYTGKGKNRKRHTRTVRAYKYYYTPNSMNGTETYIWAADRTDAKGEFVGERVAEEVFDSTEYTPDINDPEFKAKSLFWTKKFFDKSLLLASMVEDEFSKAGRPSRGVKQRNWRGIWVLQATAMPSILVETGFMTYKDEEDYLNSEKGQDEISQNVYNAVERYLATNNGKPVARNQGTPATQATEQKPRAVMPSNHRK